MIIDLSGGKNATSYPVRYTTTAPAHVLGAADEPCQTTEIWLKRIKGDGSFMFCQGYSSAGYFKVNMTKDGSSENAYVPFTVINTRGFDLPQTGGEGNWLFPVIGLCGLAMCIGGMLLVMRKKPAKE